MMTGMVQTMEAMALWCALRGFESFVFYYVIQFGFYAYHRILHAPWSGPLYRMHHIGHHKKTFPVRRLRALVYGSDSSGSGLANKNGWFSTGGELAFGVPFTCIAVLSLAYLPRCTAATLMSVMIYVAVTGEVLHSSYHLFDDAHSHPESLLLHRFLVGCTFFRRYQHLHDIHHARPNTNFGFFDFSMDRLFGTYESQPPQYLTHPPSTSDGAHAENEAEKDSVDWAGDGVCAGDGSSM